MGKTFKKTLASKVTAENLAQNLRKKQIAWKNSKTNFWPTLMALRRYWRQTRIRSSGVIIVFNRKRSDWLVVIGSQLEADQPTDESFKCFRLFLCQGGCLCSFALIHFFFSFSFSAQPPGIPEICKKSLTSCPASGGTELFILGKNFLKDTKIVFQNSDANPPWEEAVLPDKEFLQQVCVEFIFGFSNFSISFFF